MGNNNTHPLTGPEFRKVFTDGSSHGNPGPAGWSWFMDKKNFDCGYDSHATNQRMEMTAILSALEAAPRNVALEILTDSEFCVNAYTQWIGAWARNKWKKKDGSPISNQDLVIRTAKVLSERRGTKTVFTHVKAHCGIVNNEVCDRLANKAADAQRPLRTPGWTDRTVHVKSANDVLSTSASLRVRDREHHEKPMINIVGEVCPSCGRQINPLTNMCGCFSL